MLIYEQRRSEMVDELGQRNEMIIILLMEMVEVIK